MVDAFRLHIMQTKELGTCPVRQIGCCSFLYMRISNVYIVTVVSRNANVACAFKFVVEVSRILFYFFYICFLPFRLVCCRLYSPSSQIRYVFFLPLVRKVQLSEALVIFMLHSSSLVCYLVNSQLVFSSCYLSHFVAAAAALKPVAFY